MSLQQNEPADHQLEALQQVAARIIQRSWRRYTCRGVFKHFKELLRLCNWGEPKTILKTVNPREAELLDFAAGAFIRFRLGGITFPPNIYYKIFTYRPVTDLCASSPKVYTQGHLERPSGQRGKKDKNHQQEDRTGWYQRMENNSWRLFCSNKLVHTSEPAEIGADKKKDFHYSHLQRQQDVIKWSKKRKTEWLKQIYHQGRMKAHAEDRQAAVAVDEDSDRGRMEITEDVDEDGLSESALDEFLTYSSVFNFEEYVQEWKQLASSQSSDLHQDVPSCSHQLADQNSCI